MDANSLLYKVDPAHLFLSGFLSFNPTKTMLHEESNLAIYYNNRTIHPSQFFLDFDIDPYNLG
jgi:hypothetical protein